MAIPDELPVQEWAGVSLKDAGHDQLHATERQLANALRRRVGNLHVGELDGTPAEGDVFVTPGSVESTVDDFDRPDAADWGPDWALNEELDDKGEVIGVYGDAYIDSGRGVLIPGTSIVWSESTSSVLVGIEVPAVADLGTDWGWLTFGTSLPEAEATTHPESGEQGIFAGGAGYGCAFTYGVESDSGSVDFFLDAIYGDDTLVRGSEILGVAPGETVYARIEVDFHAGVVRYRWWSGEEPTWWLAGDLLGGEGSSFAFRNYDTDTLVASVEAIESSPSGVQRLAGGEWSELASSPGGVGKIALTGNVYSGETAGGAVSDTVEGVVEDLRPMDLGAKGGRLAGLFRGVSVDGQLALPFSGLYYFQLTRLTGVASPGEALVDSWSIVEVQAYLGWWENIGRANIFVPQGSSSWVNQGTFVPIILEAGALVRLAVFNPPDGWDGFQNANFLVMGHRG